MTFAFSMQNNDLEPMADPGTLPADTVPTTKTPATGSQGHTALAAPVELHPAATDDPLPQDVQSQIRIVLAAGQFDKAASVCGRLLNTYKTSAFLWTTLGMCHAHQRALNDALTCLNRGRELAPTAPEPHLGMAGVYLQLDRPDAAEAHFRTALGLDARNAIAMNNFANFLTSRGRTEEAADLLQQALEQTPQNAVIAYNLANARRQLGDAQEAKRLYGQALALRPDLSGARFNYGQLLYIDREFEAAAVQFDRLVAENPEDDRAQAYRLHVMAMLNDFRWTADYDSHRKQLGLRGTPVSPFTTLAMEDNPDLLRVRTQAYAATQFTLPRQPSASFARPTQRPERLRVGYFSADFHCHATMYLMAGLLRSHDADRFEIHAFSYGPQRDDAQRSFARNHVAQFHEVSETSDRSLIDLARAQHLDIAVDLKGFTGGSRCSIFAERVAPVQITYLGYPGTLGAATMDYLITDEVVSPPGSERHFDEHLIRLPHSYQPNDPQRTIAPRQFTRADCGLPEEGFIFCCFNNSYKITPREFDIWMRLLAQVEGSVLWLLSGGTASETNLRREAVARGIAPERLVFAERMAQDQHLARQKAADLFLDTFAVNAHTTCSDALWAGLPVLTMPGQQFAARVGASLVSAVNLPELIATDEADYERLALHFAKDPEALMSLRSKLAVNRRKAPLFDAGTYARGLEAAFDAAFAQWLHDAPKTHLTVSVSNQDQAQAQGTKPAIAAA